jgi:hypothetical protein
LLQGEVGRRSDYIKEEDLPTNCILAQFENLVSRQPGTVAARKKTSGASEAPEGYRVWKGKMVKNYKNFKKVSLKCI